MAEFLAISFYLLGGWMFIMWSSDNPPPKSWYLIWTIPLWPVVSLAFLFCAFSERAQK